MSHASKTKREYVLSALDKYERQLTRYAQRMLAGNSDLAADAVQFVFLKLCQQDHQKPDGQLKAWLYSVCRNRIIDEFRKRGRQTNLDPVHIDSGVDERGYVQPQHSKVADPQANAQRQEDLNSIKQRIDALSEQDREIIDLWSHGLKHNEIAEVVAKSSGAVRVQLHRIINRLKWELRDQPSQPVNTSNTLKSRTAL